MKTSKTARPDRKTLERKMWVQTHTGVAFHPFDPRKEDVRISDIAWALAGIVRFNGHAPERYTVAQHSVVVATRATKIATRMSFKEDLVRRVAVAALLHDASEAYLGDMVRPLKTGMPKYKVVEKSVQGVIEERFGVWAGADGVTRRIVVDVVKRADEDALATEAARFFPASDRPKDWGIAGCVLPDMIDSVMSHGEARLKFASYADVLGLCGVDEATNWFVCSPMRRLP